MRRTIAAVLIFVFALGFSAYCEIYSARVTQTLCGSAQALKQQALAGDFAAAEATLAHAEEYFSRHRAGLEMFSQRTGGGAIAVSLAGLRGFLNEENLIRVQKRLLNIIHRFFHLLIRDRALFTRAHQPVQKLLAVKRLARGLCGIAACKHQPCAQAGAHTDLYGRDTYLRRKNTDGTGAAV